jgi:hypothetical protein
MGQLKKLKTLIDSFERLPDGNFKESVRIDMEQMKELFSEIHSLRELKDKLHLDELDYKYEHNQLNEINNLNDIIKATPEYKLGKSIIEDAKNKGEA